MQAYPLGARAGATDEFDAAFRHTELLRQEGDQAFVGLAVHRRRGETDFQGIAVQSRDFAFLRSGLNVQRQHNIGGGTPQPAHLNAKDGIEASTLSRICSISSSTIGDTSTPPISGIRFCRGRRKGRAMMLSTGASGAYGF